MSDIALDLGKLVTATGVKTNYGEPLVVDGQTILPVSLGWYGFGGGAGSGAAEAQEGNGGGGGGASIPIGAYISHPDGIRFHANIVSVMAVGIPFVWVAGRSLARLVKALKK
jgi:uncharacterized spore protein YtfJ